MPALGFYSSFNARRVAVGIAMLADCARTQYEHRSTQPSTKSGKKEGPDTLRVEAEEVAPPRPIILGTTSRGVRRATISALINDVQINPPHINAANAGVVPALHCSTQVGTAKPPAR